MGKRGPQPRRLTGQRISDSTVRHLKKIIPACLGVNTTRDLEELLDELLRFRAADAEEQG